MAGRKKGKARCEAYARSTGEQCKAMAVPGYPVCRVHGAHKSKHPGNPNIAEIGRKFCKGKIYAVKIGTFSKELLTDKERQIYEEVEKFMRDTFGLENPAEQILLDQLAFASAKLYVARRAGDERTIKEIEARIGKRLKELNIRPDKDQRSAAGKLAGPQALFLAVLQKFDGQKRELPAASSASRPLPGDGPPVIEAEIVEDPEETPAPVGNQAERQ